MATKRTRGARLLAEFLRRAELSQFELASLAGVSPMQVSHLILGRRKPSLKTAVRLEQMTRGKVPTKAWVE